VYIRNQYFLKSIPKLIWGKKLQEAVKHKQYLSISNFQLLFDGFMLGKNFLILSLVELYGLKSLLRLSIYIF
tara:strand:- start:2016 stop:2231 length:216 start_codon:yes stop_codon:yes gene_type:complete